MLCVKRITKLCVQGGVSTPDKRFMSRTKLKIDTEFATLSYRRTKIHQKYVSHIMTIEKLNHIVSCLVDFID